MIEDLVKTQLRVPREVRDWYAAEGKALGLNMGQHMSLILTTHYRNQQIVEATRILAQQLPQMQQYDPKDIKQMLDFMSKELPAGN